MTITNAKKWIADLLRSTANPLKQRALFIGALSKMMEEAGAPKPIVVGGQALEIYTQGSYTTGDIDLKANRKILFALLRELGFERTGRVWVQREWDIWVDWVGAALEEGRQAEEKTPEFVISAKNPSLKVRVLSLEDLLIDRLAAAKFWKDTESARWAKVLINMRRSGKFGFDMKYFMKRLKAENLADEYARLSARKQK